MNTGMKELSKQAFTFQIIGVGEERNRSSYFILFFIFIFYFYFPVVIQILINSTQKRQL
jgi:hypothetical protein